MVWLYLYWIGLYLFASHFLKKKKRIKIFLNYYQLNNPMQLKNLYHNTMWLESYDIFFCGGHFEHYCKCPLNFSKILSTIIKHFVGYIIMVCNIFCDFSSNWTIRPIDSQHIVYIMALFDILELEALTSRGTKIYSPLKIAAIMYVCH